MNQHTIKLVFVPVFLALISGCAATLEEYEQFRSKQKEQPRNSHPVNAKKYESLYFPDGLKEHIAQLKVTKTSNVRTGPGTRHAVIGTATINSTIRTTHKSANGWYLLERSNKPFGYVWGKLLEPIPAPPSPSPKPSQAPIATTEPVPAPPPVDTEEEEIEIEISVEPEEEPESDDDVTIEIEAS